MTDLDKQIEEAEQKLEDAESNYNYALDEISRLEAKINDLECEIADYEDEHARASQIMNETEEELVNLRKLSKAEKLGLLPDSDDEDQLSIL